MHSQRKNYRIARNALGAPLVTLTHYLVGSLINAVGCLPRFVDADFLDLPVVDFLLAAITLAALTLIVFAGIGCWRMLRAPGGDREARLRRQRWAVAGLVLVPIAFAITASAGSDLLAQSCAY